jgi:hypothetical protein
MVMLLSDERFQSVSAMAQALAHAASVLPASQWKPLSSRGVPRIAPSGNRPMMSPSFGHATTDKDAHGATTDRDAHGATT